MLRFIPYIYNWTFANLIFLPQSQQMRRKARKGKINYNIFIKQV